MEFHEKLQALRKRSGLTQDELAQKLYVSRTAVSKWESGRGYPNIDSLKAIAVFFGVSVDDLLSADQVLTVAAEETRAHTARLQDVVFGVLDISTLSLLVLPILSETINGMVHAVYVIWILITALFGVFTVALRNCHCSFWLRYKSVFSLAMSGGGLLLFILSPQPYAAAVLFAFSIIKVILWMIPIVSSM